MPGWALLWIIKMKERLIITYGRCWAGRPKYPSQVRTPAPAGKWRSEHSQPLAVGAHRPPPTASCRLQSPRGELSTRGSGQKSMLRRERRNAARLVSVVWPTGPSDSHSGEWTEHRTLMILAKTRFSSSGGRWTGGAGWLLQDPQAYAIRGHSLVLSCIGCIG